MSSVLGNQFAAFGATFTNFGWDNANFGQAGSTGFAGGDLVNGIGNFPVGPVSIAFTTAVTDAAFAAVDQGAQWLVQSYLSNVLVESFLVGIPLNPGVGFIGFTGSLFDEIRMSTGGGSALTIDTLQFNVASAPIPEPSAAIVFALGLTTVGLRMRRRGANAA